MLYNTRETIRSTISAVGDSLEPWTLLVRREKAIYHTMNSFSYDSSRKCLIAEGWCPTASISEVTNSLRLASERSGTAVSSVLNEVKTTMPPPTFHKTNKFTAGFQAIVDSYGMATYREVNPGLFTIISFPFLFAVMFGDFGHGILVSLAGIALVLNEQKLSKLKGEVCLIWK